MTEKKSITLTQYILTIHGVQMGQDVLTLPSDVAAVAGTDGWISVIIGSIITMIVSLCIVSIMAKLSRRNFSSSAHAIFREMGRKSLHDYLGTIFPYVCYCASLLY